MTTFAEMMDQALQTELAKAKSQGFQEAQKHFNERENKVLLNISGFLYDLEDQEMDVETMKMKIKELTQYIRQYRDYNELK